MLSMLRISEPQIYVAIKQNLIIIPFFDGEPFLKSQEKFWMDFDKSCSQTCRKTDGNTFKASHNLPALWMSQSQ